MNLWLFSVVYMINITYGTKSCGSSNAGSSHPGHAFCGEPLTPEWAGTEACPAPLTRRSFGALPETEPGLEELQPSGWFYRLSPHVVLCTRRQPAATEALAQIIYVKRGEAFPPGHPTTRLSLDLLREALAASSVNRLLDVGCGAGLLGLAAAALKVPRVVGVDISPAAVHITRENARNNGLAGALQVVRGSTECLQGPFDLVIANLPWEVQMDKGSELSRLAVKGSLILSGFRDNQEDRLIQTYQGLGWSLRQRLIKEFRHPELPPDISFTWVAWWLEAQSA
jgi:predicted RNA methylase